jgi:DNA repair protein SbcD/Mre11
MNFIHTSDWHLGRSLYGRKRTDEFEAFLNWMIQVIETHHIDALLVAGDVFDNATPSNASQALYYRFLFDVARSCCRHVVIIAGNHDSPTFLEAPRELLRFLNVHVIGSKTDQASDHVITLQDKEGDLEALVCAVPYLRDRDIRTVEAGETMDDKNKKLIMGIREHYRAVCAAAEKNREQHPAVPIIAMGHVFTAGGRTIEDDGVRDLYVGSLAHVPVDLFPRSIDYLALGHLHVPQIVGREGQYRYSGSPIPMGFGEAGQKKTVIKVETSGRSVATTPLTVPCFQRLVCICGELPDIIHHLNRLKEDRSTTWVEIDYTGSAPAGDLRVRIDDLLEDTAIEVLRIKNRQATQRVLESIDEEDQLTELDTVDVFRRCLDQFDVPDNQRDDLLLAYREILQDMVSEDTNA